MNSLFPNNWKSRDHLSNKLILHITFSLLVANWLHDLYFRDNWGKQLCYFQVTKSHAFIYSNDRMHDLQG